MTDNAIQVNGIEVYTHDIYSYADQFIQEEIGGGEKAKEHFTQMLFYIADRIEKPPHDIDLLDGIFEIYIRLCVKYGVLPSLQGFSFLVKINNATFSDWKSEKYSATHSQTVKKWFDTCKSFTVDRLHNAPKVEVNLIFIAKAAYGMAETAGEPIENYDVNKPQLTAQEIHQARLERKRPEIRFDEAGNVLDVE